MSISSMKIALPTQYSPCFRRVNRHKYKGVAAASLRGDFATLGMNVTEGEGNLPKVVLTSTSGSEADVYLFGGCITSWKLANGKDLLFVRPDAVFNKKKPISGGIPHCFPQFGPGPIQQHGFARNVDWSILDSESVEGNPGVTLELKDDAYSRSMWDFSFQATYKIILTEKSLSTELIIKNTDKKPFSFTTALHTYFRASITGVEVEGLKGCKTLNKDPDPTNPLEGVEERDVVSFPGFVDCVYLDAPGELSLDNGLGDTILIKNTNWSDAVLWNPHLQMEACYRDFVCVENAKIRKVELEPDQSWTALQHLRIA
ncbi:putative glucose-6-phosphate 1-epimerase [Momordica charantia]|uniref:glucose-6-phosphate 1-epimerase n=1 Tax=Momordica charantia TaxID=3673 RepID=A0A6J1C4N5_MOMCH|nr:putative glucose-6-phosphate 1-epimerase [Momordica charantia]